MFSPPDSHMNSRRRRWEESKADIMSFVQPPKSPSISGTLGSRNHCRWWVLSFRSLLDFFLKFQKCESPNCKERRQCSHSIFTFIQKSHSAALTSKNPAEFSLQKASELLKGYKTPHELYHRRVFHILIWSYIRPHTLSPNQINYLMSHEEIRNRTVKEWA